MKKFIILTVIIVNIGLLVFLVNKNVFNYKDSIGVIGNNDYEKSLAALIQSNVEDNNISNMFKGKTLDEEFCFTKEGIDNSIEIECLVPSEKINFDLQRLEGFKRDDNIVSVLFEDKPEYLQDFDLINSKDHPGLLKEVRLKLENKINNKIFSAEDVNLLAYTYKFTGDYQKAKDIIENNCNDNIKCNESVEITFIGKVVDEKGMPLKDVEISAISYNYSVKTNELGEYKLNISASSIDKIRLKATKFAYPTQFLPFEIIKGSKKVYDNVDFELRTYETIVEIDVLEKTAKGDSVISTDEGLFTVQTSQTKYDIPFNIFVTNTGEKYLGKLTGYFFEFNRTTRNNLILNDVFDNFENYVGNLMDTFGMPYAIFLSPEGQQLYIEKKTPVDIIYEIPEKEYFFNTISKQELVKIVDYSKEKWINTDYITDFGGNERLPLWWMMDQKTGVWEIVDMKLLDTNGKIQTFFYTKK